MKGRESRAFVDGDRGGECAILGMGASECITAAVAHPN